MIEAVGDEVAGLRPGYRVAYAAATPRAYAQATVMPVSRSIKLPDFIDDKAAATTLLNGLTVQYLIRSAYTINQGETILVRQPRAASVSSSASGRERYRRQGCQFTRLWSTPASCRRVSSGRRSRYQIAR